MKITKSLLVVSSAFFLLTPSQGQVVYSADFSNTTGRFDGSFDPLTQTPVASNSGADGILGSTAVEGGNRMNSGQKGAWLFSTGNSGINEAGGGLADGTAGNPLSSTGLARPQDILGTNARAISAVFEPGRFTDGVEYTISFKVIGQQGQTDNGRIWVAELYDWSNDETNSTDYIIIDGTHGGWGAGAGTPKPFTTNGSAKVNYLIDSASNGALLDGETVEGTTENEFTFIYNGSNDRWIGISIGTYNNTFAIDDFEITAVPEPSTYALLAGLATLGLVIMRRRRADR
jgi:hypothetical protein